MATKSFYLLNTAVASGGDYGNTQEDGTAPATANQGTGWIPGTLTAPRYADMDRGVILANAAADATYGWITTVPANAPASVRGNAFRTPSALTGSFANANWTFSFVMRATSGTAQRGAMRCRVYRSANADGSSPTLVGTALETGITAAASSSNTTAITATMNPGALTLTNEYLFFVLTWRVTTAGQNGAANWVITTDTNTKVVTADFTAATTVTATGFADTEAFGTAAAQLGVASTGFADTESFGTLSVGAAPTNVGPTGFADTETFGTEVVQLSTGPTGFAETEAFGTTSAGLIASATGFADSEAFGTATYQIRATNVGAFTDTEAFGALLALLSVVPAGFADSEAFGTSVFRINVGQAGFADSEAFGTLIASDNSTTNVFPAGFADTESFGTLVAQLSATPTGFVEAESFGTPLVVLLVTEVGGFADTELFGVLSLGSVGEASVEDTLYILAEHRTLVVKREDRDIVIAREDRLLTLELEKRTLTIPAEDRTLVVK